MVTWWLEPTQEVGRQLLSWGMFARCTLYGLGAGLGWALAILLIAGLRKKMGYSNVPVAFRGVAITMIVTGVMAMAFMGFTGMVTLP
jgi:Na+-transporting NADH:ubiquinone oxidoreductase subunit E